MALVWVFFYSCFYIHVCIIVYSYIRVMVHMHLNIVLGVCFSFVSILLYQLTNLRSYNRINNCTWHMHDLLQALEYKAYSSHFLPGTYFAWAIKYTSRQQITPQRRRRGRTKTHTHTWPPEKRNKKATDERTATREKWDWYHKVFRLRNAVWWWEDIRMDEYWTIADNDGELWRVGNGDGNGIGK